MATMADKLRERRIRRIAKEKKMMNKLITQIEDPHDLALCSLVSVVAQLNRCGYNNLEIIALIGAALKANKQLIMRQKGQEK